MAVQNVLSRTVDLAEGVRLDRLGRLFAEGDRGAAAFEIALTRGGAAVPLTGATITGWFIRADETTVAVAGTASGNVARLALPQACYAQTGRFSLVIKADTDGVSTAIYWADGTVTRTSTDATVDPEHVVPDLPALLAQIEAMRQAKEAAIAATSSAGAAAQAAYGARDAANSAAHNANNAASSVSQSIREIVTASDTAIAGADAAATRADEAALAANAAAQVVADSYIPQLTIGTVEDVARDAAYATITGTLQAPRLNLGLPRGLDGPGALYAQPENPEITTLTLSDDATGALETRIQQVEAAVATKGGKALWVNMGTISSLPVTKNVAGVTTDMVCAHYEMSTPSAQISNWTINTDVAGRVTVSGTISGSTSLIILLVPKASVTAS